MFAVIDVIMINPLFSHKKYWAHRFGIAPTLPMSREEMDALGWDSCDIILINGDAYIDHPSFGVGLIGRVLEAQGFRVGVIAQPDINNDADFQALGKPNLYFAISAGNMDSMINHYTSDKKKRHNDAYTPNDAYDKRPDRAVIKYTNVVKKCYKDVPVIIGGIEASLRRLAHYDYWSDKIRRSVLLDAKADLLVYGSAERAIVEISHRIANGQSIKDLFDVRGVAFVPTKIPDDFAIIDSSDVDKPGTISKLPNPYDTPEAADCEVKMGEQDASLSDAASTEIPVLFSKKIKPNQLNRHKTVINLPSYTAVVNNPILYAHTNRVFHLETNPGNARHLMQQHDGRRLWVTPPPIPLSTPEMDAVFGLPYSRRPHPTYGDAKISAYEMIKNSVMIMRGCFGGCTFCSITEHEGRIIQSRSEESILEEIENIRDKTPGFAGIISDLGGPTANMYRLGCKSREIEKNCRKLSCVYPGICSNLDTNHQPLIALYRKARQIKGVKRVFVASGLRYDLAVESPEYVRELVEHHVGGYLKIAPEHTERGPLDKMMKPGMGTYDRFKKLFEETSKSVGKEQYLIPYFIAAHPGTRDEDMLNLAVWLKSNGFRADQVQAFLPSPMSIATAMWHTGFNPLKGLRHKDEVVSAKDAHTRKLHKAFLRYHDPDNWPLLRDALKAMGREDLIGNGKKHLVPTHQPKNIDKPSAMNSTDANSTKNRNGAKNPKGQKHRAVKKFTTKNVFGESVATDTVKSRTIKSGASPKTSSKASSKASSKLPATTKTPSAKASRAKHRAQKVR